MSNKTAKRNYGHHKAPSPYLIFPNSNLKSSIYRLVSAHDSIFIFDILFEKKIREMFRLELDPTSPNL